MQVFQVGKITVDWRLGFNVSVLGDKIEEDIWNKCVFISLGC